MMRITLGRTGISAAPCGFGALAIQRISHDDSVRLMKRAFEGGINFFDTARCYTTSEERLGAAFSGMRDKVVIASKTMALTAGEFREDLETSLRNLKSDYIDLYQFHNPPFCPKPGDGSGLYEEMLKARNNRVFLTHSGCEQQVIDAVYAQLLPADKVAKVEELLQHKTSGATLVYVGDGINDAPVLTRSDVGIAMGALGSDAAVEAADIVLMDDDPRKIVAAIQSSRRTMSIARQNIIFALVVKLLVLALVAIGVAGMWLAVFADVGVAVIAILNAMRAMKINL